MVNLRNVEAFITTFIASLIGAPATAAEAVNPPLKSVGQSFWESLPGLLWATLAIGATLYFSQELKRLLWSIVLRLKSGSAVKFGLIELAASTSPIIPVAIQEGGYLPDYATKFETDKGELAELRDRYAAYSNYAMLVHKVFPSEKLRQEYDVLLYFVERQEGALLGVR